MIFPISKKFSAQYKKLGVSMYCNGDECVGVIMLPFSNKDKQREIMESLYWLLKHGYIVDLYYEKGDPRFYIEAIRSISDFSHAIPLWADIINNDNKIPYKSTKYTLNDTAGTIEKLLSFKKEFISFSDFVSLIHPVKFNEMQIGGFRMLHIKDSYLMCAEGEKKRFNDVYWYLKYIDSYRDKADSESVLRYITGTTEKFLYPPHWVLPTLKMQER